MTDDFCKLTGKTLTNVLNFVKLHADEFKRTEMAQP